MHEAGFEWNTEKKELKKIEQIIANNIPQDFEKCVEHLLSLSDGEGHGSPAKVKEVSAELFKLAKLEQNTVWTKEDEDYYDAIIAKLEVTQEDAALTDNQMDFLKSLKIQLKQKNL